MKQIRKPFNIVMALILLIVVTIATIAFSSWLITDEITEKPIYQPGTVAKHYLDNQKDTYDGTSQAPTSPLFAEGELSYQYRKSGDTDYISGKPTDAGIYDIRVTIKENNEKVDVSYQIKPKPFNNDFTVQVKGDKFVHTGTAITPKITLMDDTTTLIEKTDYTLDYENNIALGNAKIIITGIGNYEGTLNQEFAIVGTSKLEIICTSMQQLTYNGKSQLPEYTVKCGSDIITDAIVEIQYKDPYTGEYINDKPKHAGIYSIRISAKKEGYEDSDVLETKVKINPKEIAVTWENLNLVYNKTEQRPIAKSSDLEDDGSTLEVTGKQTNAGSYTAKASVDAGHAGDYTIKSGESSSFTIKPLGLSLNKYLIEMNYDSSKRTWALIQTYISGQLSLSGLLSGDTVSLSISGMNDGTFGYGSDTSITGINNNDKTGITSYTNVVGSTYLVTVALTGSSAINYTLRTGTPVIFKYKTAIVNGAYYTIEKAITEATGDITFAGDDSNASSFVYTAFSNLASSVNPYKENKNEYLISGRKFIVPCSTSVLKTKYSSTTSPDYVYSSVYIPDDITINFVNGSELLADGVINFAQPNITITKQRGVLYNNGYISIANGCSLNAYGYVKGFGTIDLASGASATDCMHTYDWPGGNAASGMNDDVLPTNAWSAHNISCKTRIYAGATYYGYVYFVAAKQDLETTALLIGSDTSKNSLFKITSGYIEKSATPATSTPNDKTLYLVTGSNQIKGQRDLVRIYGNCVDSKFKMSVTALFIITVNMETNTSKPATIGYMDIYVESGSNFSLSNSDYLFLPGSKFVIEKGATVTIGSNVDVTMATWSAINSLDGNNCFKSYCVDTTDAKAIINGTLIVNGSIGGTFETTLESAVLNISGGSVTSRYVTMINYNKTKDIAYFAEGQLSALGNIDGIENSNFQQVMYVSVNNNGTYYWTEATNVAQFNLHFYDGDTLLETKVIVMLLENETIYQVNGSEYVPAKKYYEFIEWTLNKAGTIKLDSENSILVNGTNNDINLYAQWEAKKYSINYIAAYGETENGEIKYISIDDLVNVENLVVEFTINDFINGEISLFKDLKYYAEGVEKYFEGWYVGIDKSTGVIIDKITTKYLDAFIEKYGENQSIPLFCNFIDEKPIEINYRTEIGELTRGKDILQGTGKVRLPDITENTYNNYQYNFEYTKYFVGWQINGTSTIYSAGQEIDISSDTTFVAVWEQKAAITINIKNNVKFNITVGNNGKTYMANATIYVPKQIEIYYSATHDDTKYTVTTKIAGSNQANNGSYKITGDTTIELTASKCVAEGSKITLADGSTKNIEDLNYDDMLIGWDFVTGKYVSVPASILWNHGKYLTNVINLKFSDGTIIRVVEEHGFFDIGENSYVFINENNYESYLHHTFVKTTYVNGTFINESFELIDAYITEETIGVYSLQTAYTINFVVDGALSITPMATDALISYFEMGDNLMYDQEKMQADIEKYGLYTYEDFAEYVTYEQFVAFNGAYLKVAVGKGLITWEEILELIRAFVN